MQIRNNDRKKIVISTEAKEDLENILSFLSENWGDKVVREFLQKINTFYYIVSVNPRLFGYYNKTKNIRKYIISRHNIIYYRISKKEVQIITVFDTRQNPSKLRKKLK
jgi:plasmid stabilization system protein ParE